MPMEQDITLPFITVNKHKVSKSCFGWVGGGGGSSLMCSLLCSFGMLCLLVTETVCIFSYTRFFLSCFHICSGTPYNSISSCYFLSPWNSFSHLSIHFPSNIYIFWCFVPSPSLKESTASLANFLLRVCKIIYYLSFHPVLYFSFIFIRAFLILVIYYFTLSFYVTCLNHWFFLSPFHLLFLSVYLVIHSDHLFIEVCQVASNLCF